MNKTLQISLIVIGGIVLSAFMFGAGLIAARASGLITGVNPTGMMRWIRGNNHPVVPMMGVGFGMMGGNGSSGVANARPLTVDQAKQAVEGYLNKLNNPDLELKEIMVFDHNAYARVTEKSTGIGAMELLVDPLSLAVFPEYGPNMMWNLKYGHMNGNGMMGSNRGMMGGYSTNLGSVSATMSVTFDQAVKIAQQYIDQQFPGSQAAAQPDPFYGYYTVDILKDGKPTGMLSVNGFSGQVFLHTWHGTFIEGSE